MLAGVDGGGADDEVVLAGADVDADADAEADADEDAEADVLGDVDAVGDVVGCTDRDAGALVGWDVPAYGDAPAEEDDALREVEGEADTPLGPPDVGAAAEDVTAAGRS